MNESAIVLYKNELVIATVGTPTNVEFPFEKIWEFKRNCTLFNPAYLRFYHTHPIGFCEYSETDVNCLKGLNIAFDFPVYFSIIIQHSCYCLTHDQISYIYYKKMIEVENVSLSNEHLFLLNSLAKGKVLLC